MPYLEGGRAPSLTMIRPRDDPKARFVLRLWAAGFQLRNGDNQNLWVGSVVEEHLGRLLALFTVVRTQPDVGPPQEVLAAAIGSGPLVTRGVKRPANTWEGQILLAHDVEITVE
jgi:LssY C-terminus